MNRSNIADHEPVSFNRKSTLSWLSPLKSDEFAEYRDEALLFIYFTGDSDMNCPETMSQWQIAIEGYTI